MRMDQLQGTIANNDEKMRDFQKKLDARPAAAPQAAGYQSSSSASPSSSEEIVMLGEFNRDTPRLVAENSFRPSARLMNDRVFPLEPGGATSTTSAGPRAPGTATSSRTRLLHECERRAHEGLGHLAEAPRDLGAEQQHMRLAAIVQAGLRDPSQAQDNYMVVSWRSSSVVVLGRNVCRLNKTTVAIEPDWYDDMLGATAKNIEQQITLGE